MVHQAEKQNKATNFIKWLQMASSPGDFLQSSHAERRDIGGRVGGGGAFGIKLFQKSPRKICILLCFQSFLCAKHVFYLNESYFYSRSFQKYSRTSVENSRTFQGYPANLQFSRTFQGPCEPWHRFGLVKQHPSSDAKGSTLFLHISLPSLHDYNIKMPDVTFCGELKKAKTRFSFSFWT